MPAPAWPARLKFLLPTGVTITTALGVSLFLHAIILSIHFKLPESLNKATEQALDVILVNAKTRDRPAKAQAKAQANLDGGGNTDENRRAKTPLPVSPTVREGNDVRETRQRVAQLEAEQQQMMTRLQSQQTVASATRGEETPAPPNPMPSGVDLASAALNLARLEAQIARNTEEYNKRPRKKFIGARTEEYAAAQYLEDWRQKVERVGNLNYPEAAKGRLYGNLLLYVEIKADGSLESVEVRRSSGHKILDEAAMRIVRMAAPYGSFSAELKRQTDIVAFARTWVFTKADRLTSE